MLSNKLIPNSLIIVGGLILLLSIGYFFPIITFNHAEKWFWDEYSENQSIRLNQVRFLFQKEFRRLESDLTVAHLQSIQDYPKLGHSPRIEKLLRKLDNRQFFSLAYFNSKFELLARAPSKRPISKPKAISDYPDWANRLLPVLQQARRFRTGRLTSIFQSEKKQTWLSEIAIPLAKTETGEDEVNEGNEDEAASTALTPPSFLVATIDLTRFIRMLLGLKTEKGELIWIVNKEGDVLYHPNPSLSETNLHSFNQLDQSVSAFIVKAFESKIHSGFYSFNLFGKENVEEEFAVSRQFQIGESTIALICSTSRQSKVMHIKVAMRGLMIISLFLIIFMVLLGYVWQRYKRRDIQTGIRKNMARELDRMVEARTVELNFVTRTIKDLIDSIPSALIVLDRNLNVLLVNLSFYSIFSSRVVNVTGRNISEIFTVDEIKDRLHLALRTKEPITDVQLRKLIEGQGEKVLLINVLHLLGKRDRLLLVIDDISERKVLERQLIQAEKMAGLGTLMLGIAHEINNPLNAIAGMAQIISAREKDNETNSDARQILQHVKRVAEIIKELSRYSRSTKVTDAITADINAIINGAMAMVSHSRKLKDIEVEKHFAHDLPSLKINIVEMEQVFINLLTNAIDTLEESSQKKGDGFKKKISITTALHGDEFVQIVCEDNGMGISNDNLKSIFDPFFSTKDQGKGTGLGLSICYKIIQRYGGIILVESTETVGTKFTIRLLINP